MKENITILGKHVTTSRNGNMGSVICYAYENDDYEGIATANIWLPAIYKKPEDIVIGKRYEITILSLPYLRMAVRLTLLSTGKEVM